MFGETTDPNLGDPRALTVFDQRELEQRLEAIHARHARRKAREPREPSLLWEEAGHHGEGKAVRLRPHAFTRRNPIAHRRLASHEIGRLPAMPMPSGITTRHVVIAAGVVGAVTLGVYLWKRAKEK